MAQVMAAYHDWDHYDGQDEWIGEIIQAIGGPEFWAKPTLETSGVAPKLKGAKIIPNVPP